MIPLLASDGCNDALGWTAISDTSPRSAPAVRAVAASLPPDRGGDPAELAYILRELAVCAQHWPAHAFAFALLDRTADLVTDPGYALTLRHQADQSRLAHGMELLRRGHDAAAARLALECTVDKGNPVRAMLASSAANMLTQRREEPALARDAMKAAIPHVAAEIKGVCEHLVGVLCGRLGDSAEAHEWLTRAQQTLDARPDTDQNIRANRAVTASVLAEVERELARPTAIAAAAWGDDHPATRTEREALAAIAALATPGGGAASG